MEHKRQEERRQAQLNQKQDRQGGKKTIEKQKRKKEGKQKKDKKVNKAKKENHEQKKE